MILLLVHLLKWKYQPACRGNSWRRTINEQHTELELFFDDSPSLRKIVAEGYMRCYELARKRAADETGIHLEQFPENSLWTCEDVLRSDFSLTTNVQGQRLVVVLLNPLMGVDSA